MLSEAEIEIKYGIIHIKNKKYYKEDLSKKSYSLDYTKPYFLDIEGLVYDDSNWQKLLTSVTRDLLKNNSSKRSNLLDYIPPLEMVKPFSAHERPGSVMVGDDIYLTHNKSALRTYWMLRDVLEIFNYDLKKVKLIIERRPASEPDECIKFYENKMIKQMKDYYILLKYEEEKIDRKILQLLKLNKILHDTGYEYNNFLLIDKYSTFKKVKIKFINYLKETRHANEKFLVVADRCLLFLDDFFKNTGII